MATVNTDVLDALRSINVPEDKARAAAAALSGPSMDLAQFRGEVRTEFATVNGKINLLTWMVGFNLAMTVALLWKVFAH